MINKISKIDYVNINKASWNNRVDSHVESEFYDVKGFIDGQTSLHAEEFILLGDVKGKTILHLQCHFGQDTLSLGRLGAKVTGVDLSDKAIQKAKELADIIGTEARFICCDIYDLPKHLDQKFDIVFTSYGTIGWFPDLDKWAALISGYLNPGGKFVFIDFHPVMWMMDNDFTKFEYNYFKSDPIIESQTGTYAEKESEILITDFSWNHSMSEVMNSLMDQGLTMEHFKEYDYSVYDCFKHLTEIEKGKYRVAHLGEKIPMMYSLKYARV
ncbi:MAG: class I SAM-dependent methyltransferase [Saprospiraceae bacterium]